MLLIIIVMVIKDDDDQQNYDLMPGTTTKLSCELFLENCARWNRSGRWINIIIIITIFIMIINCWNLSDTGPSLLPCATFGVVQRKGPTLNLDQSSN